MIGAAPFVFGKLPSHGDFVQRGLDAAARDAWDEWASAGLARAREALGERFDAVHESAPPWRFRIGPGRLGEAYRVGALASSVDRVGRRFVILVGADGLEAEAARSQGRDLGGRMEGLIYDAFQSGWDVDALMAAAGQVLDEFEPASQAGEAPEGFWTEAPEADGPGEIGLRLTDVFSPDCLLRMLDPLAAEISL